MKSARCAGCRRCSNQHSAISHQPSAVSHQPSAFSLQEKLTPVILSGVRELACEFVCVVEGPMDFVGCEALSYAGLRLRKIIRERTIPLPLRMTVFESPEANSQEQLHS